MLPIANGNPMTNLTLKQESFCYAYIENGGNATAAYRKAFGPGKMKPQVLHVKASQLLAKDKVQVRIEELRQKHQKRHEVTVDRVVQELAQIAFSNAGDFFAWGPDGVRVKASSELTEAQRGVISEVQETKTEKGGTIRVKLSDKQAALEKLGRHLGIFKEVKQLTGPDGGPLQIEDVGDVNKIDLARRLLHLIKEAAASNMDNANG